MSGPNISGKRISAWRRRAWIAGAALLLLLALAVGISSGRSPEDIPSGTGYSALDLCTRTRVSGEPVADVLAHYVEPKVQPLPTFWRIEQSDARVTVATALPGLAHPRTAIFRPGLGCTLLPPGTGEAEVRAQALSPVPGREDAAPDPRPWPMGEGAAESALLAPTARAAIERTERTLFSEASADLAQHRNTTALLVARDGHLLYERYARGHERRHRQLGWSMTKTLTALIAGTLAQDDKLALDAPVGLSRWRGTLKAAITWRALLNMAPGLTWFEGYGGASDATEMLFSQADQGAWAADRPLSAEPGRVFTYSTGFSNIAMRRMRELFGDSPQRLYDHYQQRLFAPLGVRTGVIEPDASGTPVGGARGVLRPVDWLRLGQLILNGGQWAGETLVPSDWIAFMLAPSPANHGYGGSIWRVESDTIEPETRARLPDDLVFFAGHLGQFIVVVPSERLLVLRMGVDLTGSMAHDETLHEVLGLVAELRGT